jgi:MFS family permease
VTGATPEQGAGAGIADVLRNRHFLLLWLAQCVTQVGGNMVLFGLTVIIVSTSQSNAAVSALILSFLVPAVLFSAVAGVYVDRIDRRLLLVATNAIRGLAFIVMFLVGDHLLTILLLTIFVSTVTVFFAPAEGAMIPFLVPRKQLLAANGLFTLTLNAAFALGFALMGPLVVTLAGANTLLLVVAGLYLVAAAMCWTLPSSPPPSREHIDPRQAVADAERAVGSTIAQLREGLDYIRAHRNITWSLVYLGIASSLIGVLGVLGPDFARETLGLQPKDFVVVVLPLGAGIVTGILLLNAYGRFLPRRRVIEVGLICLGVTLAILSIAGPISRFLQRADQASGLVDLSAVTSLLAIVVFLGFAAGIAYAIVAIPAQTQLQEDLPEDVRGRVFGVLNMLVSVSSFLPIIIVGPVSDFIGTTTVILVVAVLIWLSGVISITRRGPLRAADWQVVAAGPPAVSKMSGVAVDPIGAMTHAEREERYDEAWAAAANGEADLAPWQIAQREAERRRLEEREAAGPPEMRDPRFHDRSRLGRMAGRIRGRSAASRPASRPTSRPMSDARPATGTRSGVDESAHTERIDLPSDADVDRDRRP